MKKFLLILIVLFTLANCAESQKSSKVEEMATLFLIQPGIFQISATITDGTPVANSMVYFSKAKNATSSSIRATDSTTTTVSAPVFTTSAQTDETGKLTFTLNVGEYEAIITSTNNKSQAFKIKIETESGLSLNKDGKATITFADGTVQVAILSVTGLVSGGTVSPSISYVCGYNPAGDTAAPELESVTLDSNTIDISSGSGKVRIKAKLGEGYEGTTEAKKASGIKTVTAKLFSPNRLSGSGSSVYATLSLNTTSGLYEGDATLTNFVENGTWKVGLISARDLAGNEREYIYDKTKSELNYTFNGCGQKIDSKILMPSIEVTGSSPDSEAPVINIGTLALNSQITGGAAQTPISNNIDVSTSTATPKEVVITITVIATDGGGTGNASGISYIDARLQSYSWWASGSNALGNAIYVRLDRTAGTNMNGTYTGKATIRSYAEGSVTGDGLWKLGGIWVNDKAGNGQFYTRDTLNKSFTIINASATAVADFYSPELKTITVDKTEVGFDQSFAITADVDDLATEGTTADQNTSTTTTTTNTATPSGVKSVKVVLYSPLKLLDNTLGVTKSLTLTLNATTSKYEGSLTFPTANNEEGGLWKVGWVEVIDKAGNYRAYRLTEGYSYYTYIKLTKTDGDISSSFNVTNISPASITRK